MAKECRCAISPTREEDYPGWYQQVVKVAELAENSAARGCMVIKPWGWGIWENIQKVLDGMIKDSGHENAYFPLFIPKSFLEKEAEHVEGFAKECAVVTHHRLEKDEVNGGLKPAGELSEPYIVRPTSETIIGDTYSKWVNSYNDLPILINQWANVVRWEMRPRLFLRNVEFLWQEGHTVHATEEEAVNETLKMLDVYETFSREYLAIPVLTGRKSANERFPGAVETYCIEAMMQDGKALQAGTSHFLGQNFSKASDIKFTDSDGQIKFGWTTSWGVSTRLIGALVMSHSDDNGLVLPPKIAPQHIVILPILKKNEEMNKEIIGSCESLKKELEGLSFGDIRIRVKIDKRSHINNGEKSWEWIKKGIPIRLEIGERDIKKDQVFLGRRDRMPKDKMSIDRADFISEVSNILEDIQKTIYQRSLDFRSQHIKSIGTEVEFNNFFESGEIGFVKCYWAGTSEDEEEIKQRLNVTIRLIERADSESFCFLTGAQTKEIAIFGRSY
jgi:prolyl-tRNA synthetase